MMRHDVRPPLTRTTFVAPCCSAARAQQTQRSAALTTPVHLAQLTLDPPLILAPMAAVTNAPFRSLCASYGATLTVSEMLHANLFVQNRVTPRFYPHETRSVQLYGTQPQQLARAAHALVTRHRVQHIDLNFGCPAPKVLRRGGGAALLADLPRLRDIVRSVVSVAAPLHVPVTAKMRLGYAGQHTYLHAASMMEQLGVSAVTLHSRSAEQAYDRGLARQGWHHIAKLVQHVSIPVFGNGDVFTAADCIDMLRYTGAAGVVIGRGCLGRPWLFADLVQAMRHGQPQLTVPTFDTVKQVMCSHIKECTAWLMMDGHSERSALRSMRKWFGWYLQGYGALPHGLLDQLYRADSVTQLEQLLDTVNAHAVCVDVKQIVRERGKLGRER